jgi:hypothetical protein
LIEINEIRQWPIRIYVSIRLGPFSDSIDFIVMIQCQFAPPPTLFFSVKIKKKEERQMERKGGNREKEGKERKRARTRVKSNA